MSNLLMVLRYIIKTCSDQSIIDMATEVLDEVKSYDKFSDEYNRVDEKFKAMDNEAIIHWLCYYYYLDIPECDCEHCVYANSCKGGESV